MAHSASRTTQGFERIRNQLGTLGPPHEYELTPSLAVKEGMMVVLTAGKVAKAAAGATNVLGVAAATVTAHATNVTEIPVYDNPFDVFLGSFADQFDGVATAGTTTTIVCQLPIHDTDNDWKGALLYVYEGTNKGCTRTISAYAHATDTLTWIDPMPAACDTTTKFIILGEGDEAGASTINVGTPGVNLKDENTIDANAPVDAVDGPLAVVAIHPRDLMMEVVIIKHLYNSR